MPENPNPPSLAFSFSFSSKCSDIVVYPHSRSVSVCLVEGVTHPFTGRTDKYRAPPSARRPAQGPVSSYARRAPHIDKPVLLLSLLLSIHKSKIANALSHVAGTSPGIFSLRTDRLSRIPKTLSRIRIISPCRVIITQ